LTENIIGGLSKIPEMFVIARNSSFTYKGKPVKVQQVAEDLGVRYVLEGSMQISADQLRVTAQLVDALKGYHVWSEKYDRKMEDFFSVQDDITLNIAIALQGKLTEGEQAKIRHSTDNLEAWALAVEAHGLLETYARENIAKARELFKKAVELDPNYAYAWTFLGWTYWVDGVYHSAHYDRKKSFESASKMAEKAISVDNNSSDAHTLLSGVYLSQKQYDEAEAFGKKAINLDPNSSENHGLVAITMQNIGKFEEAIALLKQAMRLDPYYPNWYLIRLGMCYRMVGMYEESVAALEEGLERFRKGGTAPWDRAYLYLAATYSMMGRLEKAREYVSKALEFNPKMSVDAWRKRLQYKDQQHTDRILDALRKAGLPENPPLPLPDKPSIAVLPFINMSGDPEQEYFSDGITEQIITSISKIPAIFVIASKSSFAYKNKSIKVQQIAKELSVRYVLEGSIQRDKDQVRINAKLVDALSGKHIWAEDYDRKFEDIFAIQDEIAMEIMAALQIKLTVGTQADLKYDGTKNPEAYEKFLNARYHIIRRTKEDVRLGQQFAQEAIDIDPKYAAAYRMMGLLYLDEVWFGMTKSPAKSIDKAEQMAQKAISLRGYQAPDYVLLSSLNLLKIDFDKAIEYGEKAVELGPNNSSAHFFHGMALRYAGQYKEAISKFEKAIRLNPIKPINYLNNLGWSYLLAKEYESAIKVFNEAIQRNPDYLFAYMGLAAAYNLSGDKDKSNWAAENVLRIKPKFSLAAYEKRSPIKIEKDKKRIISAMRSAGLK
jgi:TolB-like protein/Tfp pilus assembly protein PilF